MATQTNIEAYSKSKNMNSVKDFFLISWQLLAFFMLISFIVILATNVDLIWSIINNAPGLEQVTAREALDSQLVKCEEYFRSEFLGKATVYLLWGLVGCIAYMGVWTIQHFVYKVKEDIEESQYGQSKSLLGKYWESRASQYVLLFASTIVFLFLLSSLFYFVPLMESYGAVFFLNISELASWTSLLVGILIGTAYIYVLTRMWHVERYAFGSFFSGVDDQ